jgi:hypothetical protein
MSILSIFTMCVLVVLYGLAWHDKPATPTDTERRVNRAIQPPDARREKEKGVTH